ncbi:MAG: hypothetical protein NC079_08230 [Clostridium sp.]|nr:hypothetical protein [Acetatifactor muris]MCM1527302.1 hypothetical protein [Bacteroides sp.]MCM1563581.1 hypothetical protein [Clostridium sp.]
MIVKELTKPQKITDKTADQICWMITAVLVALISVLSITNGSMWGDEICRVMDPISGNFANTWKTAMGYGQPGYMSFMFVWVKLVGKTEFLMRTSNLIFVAVAFYYVYKIMQRKKYPAFLALLFFIHPMFVYYMDEVTPYIMVYALSIAFIYYVFFVDRFDSIENIIKINSIFLLGVFIHFIFGFIYVLYIFKIFANKPIKLKKHILVFLCFCVLYIPLLAMDCYGLFYLGPSTKTGFGIKNIMYIIYAFLGFVGLGISRNDLRAGNFDVISIDQIIYMGILVAVVMAIAIIWLFNRKKIKIDRKEMIGGAIAYFIVFFLFSLPIGFGLWERHCMGVLPVYVLVVMDLLYYLIKSGKSKCFLAALYVMCLMFSAANIRFNYYYVCDDYKGVQGYLTEKLEQTENITILFSADSFDMGGYYDVTRSKENDLQKILCVNLIDEDVLNRTLTENADSDKIIVVLFEKAVSSKFWHSYDAESDLNICDDYNSFRIIEY